MWEDTPGTRSRWVANQSFLKASKLKARAGRVSLNQVGHHLVEVKPDNLLFMSVPNLNHYREQPAAAGRSRVDRVRSRRHDGQRGSRVLQRDGRQRLCQVEE